jgi:hypothetical protein
MMDGVPFIFFALHCISGKSVTHKKSRSVETAVELLNFRHAQSNPAEHLAGDLPFPAAKKIQSPSAISNLERSASFSASEKNFTIGDFHSPFSTLMKASLSLRMFSQSRLVHQIDRS